MRLKTLGRPHIVSDAGDEVALQPLPLALLAYLAVGGPRDRDHLAELFWHNNKNSLNSLSTALNRIRADVPGAVWVEGNTVVGTDLNSDYGELRAAIDGSDAELVSKLYTAPFLANLKLRRQSLELEEWVLEQRTTLGSMVELVLLQRARELFTAGDYQAAATMADEAWSIAVRDGFPSPDYFDTYHRILATTAQPSANAVRTLAEEFGVELRLVEPIALDTLDHDEAGSAHDTVRATQFFGCEAELLEVAASVASQRLTTLVGLGGSGKTRLAEEYFHSEATAELFPVRHWVSLRDVSDPEMVGAAVAAALGQRFESVEALAQSLPDDQPVLLVLDNFEQVVQAAHVANELARYGDIRVLATSRISLGVAAESLVQLGGLTTAGDVLDSPAEKLFVSSARRAGVTADRLHELDSAAVRDICLRVGGNPLALEIVGGWSQLLSPPEILAALSRSNEMLDSSMVGGVRSMEAVLSQTWSTLDDADQQTLMMLATFPAGCLTKEALALPSFSISSLGRIARHSLVTMHVEGRITLHPLIASHAYAELERRPDLHRSFHEMLCGWCESFAAARQAETGDNYSQEFDGEIPNFTRAWSWAAQHRRWDLHLATVTPLRVFFAGSARLREGRSLFAHAAAALRADPDGPQQLLALVVEALGLFDLNSGDLGQARAMLNEALALCSGQDPEDEARLLRTIGQAQMAAGEVDEAVASLTAGLALVVGGPSRLVAALQCDLAQAYRYHGDRDKATSSARLALETARADKNWTIVTVSYLLLADIAVESDPDRAIVLLNEGWVIAKDAALDGLSFYFPHILGLAYLKLGRTTLAEQHFTDGLQAARDAGQATTECANYVGRAEARVFGDDVAGAIADLQSGIRLALRTGAGRYLMWAAVISCRVGASLDAPDRVTRDLLLLTLRHPISDHEARVKASDCLQELFEESAPPPEESADVSADLDEVAEWSLELLNLA